MSLTITGSRHQVLADRVFPKSLVTDLALVVGGAVLTALAAQVVVPMWPVPITGQTFAVLFVGTVLGAGRGAWSMFLYVLAGSLGLPIFTHASSGFAYFAGPTGGYLIGFIFAALLTGALAQKNWDRKVLRTIGAFAAGTAVIYLFGLTWLSYSLGNLGYPNDLNATLVAGLYPFVVGDLLKAALAGIALPSAWKLLNK